MEREGIIITPELSAQGIRRGTGAALRSIIADQLGDYVSDGTATGSPLLVDQGCGLLRNTEAMLRVSDRLVLVDTEHQLSGKHDFLGESLTIAEFVAQHWPDKQIRILEAKEFSGSQLRADAVFSVNVLDVLPPESRADLVRSARRNLLETGVFVLVIPRNDSWTIKRCRQAVQYGDGYVFANRGRYTFYHNWTREEVVALMGEYRFEPVCDLSNYRYIRMICKCV